MRGAASADTPIAKRPGKAVEFEPMPARALVHAWQHPDPEPPMSTLPDYEPPCAQRAHVAAAGGPLLVLLAFTLVVTRLIDVDTAFAVLAACTVWVAWEMHDYQRRIDGFNADYVERHLAWRSSDSLERLVAAPDGHGPTREFVQRFLRAGRVLRRDGQAI
jgi:hypothetical protein